MWAPKSFFAPDKIPDTIRISKFVIAHKVGFAFCKRGIGGKYYGAILQLVNAGLNGLIVFQVGIRWHAVYRQQALPDICSCRIAVNLADNGIIQSFEFYRTVTVNKGDANFRRPGLMGAPKAN